MKKRLISLLLGRRHDAGGDACLRVCGRGKHRTLHINSDGKPDVTEIVPTKDSYNHDVYVGDGWRVCLHK